MAAMKLLPKEWLLQADGDINNKPKQQPPVLYSSRPVRMSEKIFIQLQVEPLASVVKVSLTQFNPRYLSFKDAEKLSSYSDSILSLPIGDRETTLQMCIKWNNNNGIILSRFGASDITVYKGLKPHYLIVYGASNGICTEKGLEPLPSPKESQEAPVRKLGRGRGALRRNDTPASTHLNTTHAAPTMAHVSGRDLRAVMEPKDQIDSTLANAINLGFASSPPDTQASTSPAVAHHDSSPHAVPRTTAHDTSGDTASASPSSSSSSSQLTTDSHASDATIPATVLLPFGLCVICTDQPADQVAYPCGHCQLCEPCSKAVVAKNMHDCCQCRTKVVRFYAAADKALMLCFVCNRDTFRCPVFAVPCGHVLACADCMSMLNDGPRLGKPIPDCLICQRKVRIFRQLFLL